MADKTTSRVEYVMEAGDTHHPYLYKGKDDAPQSRYWWRQGYVTENSPVTVSELMNAVSSVMPNNRRRQTLKSLLTQSMSETVSVGNNDQASADLISVEKQGKLYDVSPSNVETMVSVLTLLHDTGIDYDVVADLDGTIGVRLNDNTAATITLVDPQHPYLAGQIRSRDGVYWSPELTRLPFQTAAEAAAKNSNWHGIAVAVRDESTPDNPDAFSEISPFANNKGTKTFQYSERKLERFYVHSREFDTQRSRALAEARYTGLDQTTKNRLALSGMVSFLGIDRSTLSDKLQKTIPDTKTETVFRLTSGSAYQAQLNLGMADANIAPVDVISGSTGDEIVATRFNDPYAGDIRLDMRSGLVGDDRVNDSSTNPKVDPFQLSDRDANDLVNVAFRDARIGELKMLLGPSQEGQDRTDTANQRAFKRSLANAISVPTLGEDGRTITNEPLEPLSMADQKDVLVAFKTGIFNAVALENGVDDTALSDQRAALNKNVTDRFTASRRLQAFDALNDQMNQTFGTSPIVNAPRLDNLIELTPGDYQTQFDQTVSHDSKQADKQAAVAQQLTQLSDILRQHPETTADIEPDQLDTVLPALPINEQYLRLNAIADSRVKRNARSDFMRQYRQLRQEHPLNSSLNLTRVIARTEGGVNSTLYGFKMAQAISKTPYANDLVGDNDFASEMVQERAVQFDDQNAKRWQQHLSSVRAGEQVQSTDAQSASTLDESTAMSINELRAADKDPNSDEAILRQYMADVKSGKKTFSFDPKENPFPAAFNYDGTKLIRDTSPNEFKAQALEVIKSHLESRGVVVNDDDIKIDAQGVVKLKAKMPFYQAATHEQQRGGNKFLEYDPNDPAQANTPHKHGLQLSRRGNSMRRSVNDNEIRYQPIEGSFGQIFAPDHDGLIRTAYNRFDGQDVTQGQFVYQARYRGWIINPDRDDSGNWSKDAFRKEAQNGLGHYNRLRVMGYDQALFREVGQATDTLITTRDLGDISRYNSNTIMNKLLHSEVLGERVEENTLPKTITPMTQAERETELNAVRMEDAAMDATKTTEVISYMKDFNKTLYQMRLNHQLTNPADPEEIKLDVIRNMHNPINVYGGHGIGEVANSAANYLFSDNMTGQGKMFGLLKYMVDGTEVLPNGRVKPNVFTNDDGSYVTDETGRYVGVASGTPLENTPFFDDSLKNAGDRQPVSKEQAIKGFATLENVPIATMALGGFTMEDGLAVSKDFAEKNLVSDEVDDAGQPIYRGLKIGDKISDNGGNKATISTIVDPDMSPKEAEQQGVLDIVQLFKQNPEFQVAMNGMSQISRNNGATAYTYLKNKSSNLSFQRYREDQLDESGNPLPNETGETVPLNATLNHGKLILTNQTINHKVTLYDNVGDAGGRKLSILLNNSDNAKGAHIVGNWHRRGGQSLQTLREAMLTMGVNLLPDKVSVVDYEKLAKETSIADYQISDKDWAKMQKQFKSTRKGPWWETKGGHVEFTKSVRGSLSGSANQMFNGLDATTGELTLSSKQFLSSLSTFVNKRDLIAINAEAMSELKYDAGEDFLRQLPDGGVLQLPDGLTVHSAGSSKPTNHLYILPERLRLNTISMANTVVQSDFNRHYQNLGSNLAKYKFMVSLTKEANLANQNPEIQAKINEQIATQLNIQGSITRINKEADRFAFGGNSPKNGFFRNYVLGGRAKDSVTSQVSANPGLAMDVIEISPQIAKRLNFTTGADGMAHIKDHDDWGMLHVHRDPVWREQGSLAFRVKINDNLTGVRISPVMASLMDADFDGDNLGLTSMPSADAQKELRQKVSVDRWMLDNSSTSSLLNINAELVDMAVNTDNTFTVTGRDGQEITGDFLNPNFRKEALENMRQDVVDPAWFNQSGELINVDDDGHPALNDGDFLNLVVNNEIKTHYATGDYVGARQAVDEIAQRARGFETTRDANGEVQIHSGKRSMLLNDGVNYTSEDTLRQSLMKFVNEGAKGKASAVSGLIDEYMKKPLFSEVKALGEQQVKNGQLDTAAQQVYREKLDGLHDTLLAVQRATKIKSDMTGIPGSMQQKLTAVMMDTSDEGMHTASSIGQAGTQKILSIKRDPVMAGRVSEMMQEPLGALLRGQFPDNAYPSFALLGAESNGRLGNDPSQVALRAADLRSYTVPETGKSLRSYPGGVAGDQFTNQQLLAVGQSIGMDLDANNTEQLDKFRQTVSEATQPYLRDDFVHDLRQTIAEKSGKSIDEVQIPVLASDKDKPGQPVQITKDEFVEVMDFFYNGHANGKTYADAGMDLGVDRQNFERLADVLADSDMPGEPIRSIEDMTETNGKASFVSKVNMHGFSAITDELNNASIAGYEPKSLFGKSDSYVRQSVFGNMSADDLTQQLDLTTRENAFNKDDAAQFGAGQDDMVKDVYADLQQDIVTAMAESAVQTVSTTQQAAGSLASIQAKTQAVLSDTGIPAKKSYARYLRVDQSGRYGMAENVENGVVGFNGLQVPLSPAYAKDDGHFKVQLSVDQAGLMAKDNQPREFQSVEQFVGFAKAAVAGSNEHAAAIHQADVSTAEGRQTLHEEIKALPAVDERKWQAVLPDVVKQATFAKFSQNEDLKQQLLDTGTADLVFAGGQYDKVLGNGRPVSEIIETDDKISDGQNGMGQVMAEVRSDLKQPKPAYTPATVKLDLPKAPKPTPRQSETKVETVAQAKARLASEATAKSSAQSAPAKPATSDKHQALVHDIVVGNYWSKDSVHLPKKQPTSTVNSQLAMDGVLRAKEVDGMNVDTLAAVELATSSSAKYQQTFKGALNNLANDYRQTTGKALFTNQQNHKLFANAYYVQMKNNPKIAEILKSDEGQKQIQNLSSQARIDGIRDALSFYDKQQVNTQAKTQTQAKPVAAKQANHAAAEVDDDLSR